MPQRLVAILLQSISKSIYQQVSNTLFRNLKNSSKYNALIKADNCNKIYEGKGDTFFTIDLMIKNIQANSAQAARLATELKKGSLNETCFSIHSFLYWHFQYKQDAKPQMVRSLNCSWLERFTGIDCKSYTVAGGIVLKQLGIKFFITKIIQPGANNDIGLGNYSHVYLRVPINQTTGNIKDGYITIDGTLPHMNEPFYIKESSFFMDNKLPHYSLNGPALAGDPALQLDWIDKLFKDLNLTKLFNSIKCLGGTAFNANILKELIPDITAYFLTIIAKYNTAIEEKRFQDVHKIYAEYWLKRNALVLIYSKKFAEGWNPCSDDSFVFTLDFLDNKIWKVLGLAFETHIVNYFSIGADRIPYNFTHPANTKDYFDGYYLWGTNLGTATAASEHGYSINVTPKIDAIPAFILTPEIEAALNSDVASSAINLGSVLATIQATAPIIFSLLGNNDPGNSGNGEVYDNNNPTPTPKPDGSGSNIKSIVGWGSALAFGGFLFTVMKDDPKKTAQDKKTTSKTN